LPDLVSLTLERGEVPVVLTLRLFLPESWTSDRVMVAGVRFGGMLADAGCGFSAPFR
jgi:hypothetical protein